MKQWFKTIGFGLFFLAIINFTMFWCIGLYFGGDAISGTVKGGRYYLSNHGELTEVSESVWNYSYYHTISVWITHPLGIGGMVLVSKLEKRPQSR